MRSLRIITGKIFLLVGTVITAILPDICGIITEDGLCYLTTEAGDVLVIEALVDNVILTEAGDYITTEAGDFLATEI